MIDPRFYGEANTFTATDLVALLMDVCQAQTKEPLPPIEIEGGDVHRLFSGVGSLKDAGPHHVAYYHKGALRNVDYENDLTQTKAGGVFVTRENAHLVPETALRFIVLYPYRAFATVLKLFHPERQSVSSVHPTAVVADTAIISEGCKVGPYAVIEEDAVIGQGAIIGAHTFIGKGVTVGEECVINHNVTLSHCILGNRVHIKPGAHIGQRGFGFEMDERGPIDMPQMGRVIIEDDVEIGANTCVDRGAFNDTVIGRGSRIDNLVQIAHNVTIGKNCILVAQVGIAGSTALGNYVVVGGQAGFSGHLNIGDGARVAAQSGVMRDIPAKTDVAGSPCVGARDWHKQTIVLKRMIDKK